MKAAYLLTYTVKTHLQVVNAYQNDHILASHM